MYTLYWLNPITGQSRIHHRRRTCLMVHHPQQQTEEPTLTVPKTTLATVPCHMVEPWTGGMLLTHTDTQDSEYPVLQGRLPIGNRNEREARHQGRRAAKIFERRTIWQTLEYGNHAGSRSRGTLPKHGMNHPDGLLNLEQGTLSEAGGRQHPIGFGTSPTISSANWTELSKGYQQRAGHYDSSPVGEQHENPHQMDFRTRNRGIPLHKPRLDAGFRHHRIPTRNRRVKVASSGKNLTNRVWCTGGR